MFTYLNRKGQSTLEYAVLIAVVVAALIAMQTYIKRGVQGKFKQASDDIGEQFSPGASTYNYTTTTNIGSTEAVASGAVAVAGGTAPTADAAGVTTTNTRQDINRTGSEHVGIYDNPNEFWPQDAPAAE